MGITLLVCKNCDDNLHRFCVHEVHGDTSMQGIICVCESPLHLTIDQP